MRAAARHIPYAAAAALGCAMLPVGGADRPSAPAHPRGGGVFREHWAYSSAKAERELGYRPRAAARRAARGRVEWLRETRAAVADMPLSAGEAKRKLLHVGGGRVRLPAARPHLAAGRAHGRGRLPVQLAGAAAHRRARAVARADEHGAGYPLRHPALPARRCSASSSCSATTCGWRPRSGACWPSATAWPRSSARRWAGRGCPGTRARAGRASRPSSSSGRSAPRCWRPGRCACRSGAWPLAAGSSRIMVPLALVCALVESLPTTLDDNLTVPLAGGRRRCPCWPTRSPAALPRSRVPARACCWASPSTRPSPPWPGRAGSIDVAGRASRRWSSAPLITAGLGLARPGGDGGLLRGGQRRRRARLRVKAARGIAQEKGGARGWRNAWANGGVPAALALLAGHVRRPALRALFVARLRGGGGHRGRRHLLLRDRQGVRPAHVPHHHAAAGAARHGGRGQPRGHAGRARWRRCWSPRWARSSASTRLACGAALVAVAGLLGSLAESVLGTVAERRGWMGNDLLNAAQHRDRGAASSACADRWRRPPWRP